jgi:23S rRNA pseudouridine1911/1915/1917 synthase
VETAPNDSVPREGTEHIELPADAAGMRLDTYLSRIPGNPSRSRIQQLVKDGRILIGGEPIGKSYSILGGETVEIRWPSASEAWPRAEAIPLDIVYEDEELLVINKQQGLITHPAPGNPDGTLVNAVLHHCPNLPGIYGIRRPGIVHRLDRDTTGLIVVAKTERAMVGLQAQIASRTAKRTYRALVIGDPTWESIRVEAPIGRDAANRLRRSIGGAFSRPAASNFRVVRRAGHHTLIECVLETGRTHQIRIHCQHIQHPIVGDELYQGAPVRSLERLRLAPSPIRAAFGSFSRPFLHAWKLRFRHPGTDELMEFEAPQHADAAELLGLLWPGETELLGVRAVRKA